MIQHPLCPANEQLARWESDWFSERENADVLLIQAFQAGADAEIDACCEWLREAKNHGFGYEYGAELARKYIAARRPKPPNLKQKALTDLSEIGSHYIAPGAAKLIDTIRRALESLPDD